MMKGTKTTKAQSQQQSDRELPVEALEIAIQNAALDGTTIKALRLTCKRTKMAADARVTEFTMSLDQEPEDVRSSGLLTNITSLDISFDLKPSTDQNINHTRKLSQAFNLLTLAVDVCKSVAALTLRIQASCETLVACGCIMGNSNWESLKYLGMQDSMPGFLSGFLSGRSPHFKQGHTTPGSLPALDRINCFDSSADDIEALYNSTCIDNVRKLWFNWDGCGYGVPPGIKAQIKSLLQKATSLESLTFGKSTVDFRVEQNLLSICDTDNTSAFTALGGIVDFATVLVQPSQTLENLNIACVDFKGPDLVRLLLLLLLLKCFIIIARDINTVRTSKPICSKNISIGIQI